MVQIQCIIIVLYMNNSQHYNNNVLIILENSRKFTCYFFVSLINLKKFFKIEEDKFYQLYAKNCKKLAILHNICYNVFITFKKGDETLCGLSNIGLSHGKRCLLCEVDTAHVRRGKAI